MRRLVRRVRALVVVVAGVAAVLPVGPPAHAPALSETVLLDSASPKGASTVGSLVAGRSYRLSVRGTFAYASRMFPGATADAECSNLPPDTTFQRNRFVLLEPGEDLLDVYVNNASLEWEPVTVDALGCNSTDHHYQLLFRPEVTGPLHFRVRDLDNAYGDNQGVLTVGVQELAETLVDAFALPSNVPSGVLSNASLDPSKLYRFEIQGTFTYGVDGGAADAECANAAPGTPFVRDLWGPAVSGPGVGPDPLDVYVADGERSWQPKQPTPAGCDESTHGYTLVFRPPAAGQVKLHVNDSFHGDNVGLLDVKIFEVSAVMQTPTQTAVPRIDLVEEVMVDSRDPDGTFSLPVREGDSILLEARGTFGYGVGEADAECSNTPGDPTFTRNRHAGLDPANDLLDVYVNGGAVDWVSTEPDAAGCNSSTHVYRHIFVPTATAPVHLRVLDTNYLDNLGSIGVRVFRIREIPLGAMTVSAKQASGARTLPLLNARTYRLAVNGVYSYSPLPDDAADAECSITSGNAFSPAETVWRPSRYSSLDTTNDLLDLLVNGSSVPWRPATPDPLVPQCDAAGHRYDHELVANAAGPATLRIHDLSGSHADNDGFLTVEVFLRFD